MPKEILSLNFEEFNTKISGISQVKAAIENDINIQKLPFGANAQVNTSKGLAVEEVSSLNAELELIIQKLALLSEKTANALGNIGNTFKIADETI